MIYVNTLQADDGLYYLRGDTEALPDPHGGRSAIWPRQGALPVDSKTGYQLVEGPRMKNPLPLRSEAEVVALFLELFGC